MKTVKNIQSKFVIFTAVKNCSILHGHVFVMDLFIFFQGGKGDPEYIAAFQQIVMPIAYEVGSLSIYSSFPTNSHVYRI